MDFDSLESDQSAFNAGFEYLKTLIAIERNLDMAFVDRDYVLMHNLLDVLWVELHEWFDMRSDKGETVLHDKLRSNQHKAHKLIMSATKNHKSTIDNEWVEQYFKRYLALKKMIHEKGLRMPKKDDPAHALAGKNY